MMIESEPTLVRVNPGRYPALSVPADWSEERRAIWAAWDLAQHRTVVGRWVLVGEHGPEEFTPHG